MLFTRRDVFKIVFPLIIEQLLAVTVGMFDSMMVSSAGEAAISGVSLVDSINVLLIQLFAALSTGGAVLISQSLGKKDMEKTAHISKQLILTVFACSMLVSIIAITLRTPLLKLIFGKIESDVMANAQIYFLITALSYPFLGLYNSGAAIFRSFGNSKVSMIASLYMNIINIGGNALFIFGFGWGAAGAAVATLIARAFGAMMMQYLLRGKMSVVPIRGLLKTRPDFATIKSVCRIGIPSGIENSMFQMGKVLTQSVVSSCGTTHIAANAVANTLSQLQFIPATAINLAVITIVGRCIGAGRTEEAKKMSRKLLLMAYSAIWIATALIFSLLNPLLGLYDLSATSTKLAWTLMAMHSVMVSTIWPLSFSTPSSFRAAGDVKFSLFVSAISMWSCRVFLSYVFAKWLGFGVVGVWMAMFSDWICRTAFFVPHYIRGKWLNKRKPLV